MESNTSGGQIPPSQLEFAVLGPVEVRRDGHRISLGGTRQRALLALLALNAGEAVSRDRLIESLFGEDAGEGAANALQVAISRLRRSLADDGKAIVTEARGYSLQADSEHIDLSRFDRLREQGKEAAARGDPAASAEAYRNGLALWRGPPLADLIELDGLQTEIRRLEELRLVTEMDRIDAELSLGQGAELVGELEALIAVNPLQERLRGQLMLALYRSGRQADALALYRETRELLDNELGLEPGRALQELERAILVHHPALERAAPAPRRDVAVCPFKGLGSFDEADAEFFCGREQIVGDLVATLAEDTLVGVIGPSGAGKSSILRAGLLHALASGALPGSERWPIHLFRPGAHPPDVEELVSHAPDGGRVVIAVDQLEEVFTACSDERERAAFLDGLAHAALDPRRRAIVAVALRADFYGRLASYLELARLLSRSHLLVGPMDRDGLERAVVVPAERAGLEVEATLVRALTDDVAGEPGALPLLETTLLELWRRRDGDTLRLADYRRAGGVRGAVARLADGVYEQLDPDGRIVARSLLLRLAAGEADAAVRRRVPTAELTRSDPDVERVLAVLVDSRLATVDDGAVEVAHEALLREWPRMRSWLAEEADARRLRSRLAAATREWSDGGRNPTDLYRGPRLSAVLDWDATHGDELTELEREFVHESRVASEAELVVQRKRARRLGALLIGTTALLALALVAGFAALAQRSHARREARVALARELGAEAVSQPRLDTAMLLARESVALNGSTQTYSTLLATLLRSPAAIATFSSPITARPQRLSVSPDGRTLAVSDNQNAVRFYDLATRRVRGIVAPFAYTAPVTWTSDGSRFLALGGSSQLNPNAVQVRDARSLRVVEELPLDHRFLTTPTNLGLVAAGRQSAFFAYATLLLSGADGPAYLDVWRLRDGKRLVTAARLPLTGLNALQLLDGGRRLLLVGDNGALLLDTTSLRVLRKSVFEVPLVNTPSASPDGTMVALGNADGTITLVDLRTGGRRTLVGGSSAAVDATTFSPDGRTLVTTAEDGSVIVWDVRSGQVIDRLVGHASRVGGAAISNDGQTLFTCSLDGAVFVWDLGSKRRFGVPLVTIPARQPPPVSVGEQAEAPPFALSPDGLRFASRLDATRVGIFATSSGARLASFASRVKHVAALAWSRTGLAVSGDDGAVQLWSTRDRPQLVGSLRGLGSFNGLLEAVTALAFSPDGRLLAAGDVNHTPGIVPYRYGTVAVWDVTSRRRLWRTRSARGWVHSVAFSPDGRTVAAAYESGDVALDDARTGERRGFVHVQGGGNLTPLVTGFAPDGTLYTGSDAGIVQRWNPVTLHEIGQPTLVAAAPVSSFAFSPDGSLFATTGGSDGIAKLWTTSDAQQVGSDLVGSRGYWGNAAFTPDGTQLVVIYQDGTGDVWPTSVSAWEQHACAVAGRNFTREEWRRFVGSQPYRPACPGQPIVSGR